MRRFTRLKNALSKKPQNLNRAMPLHFDHYTFCRKHQTIKTTRAIATGLTRAFAQFTIFRSRRISYGVKLPRSAARIQAFASHDDQAALGASPRLSERIF
jgi:hypothetical protein